VQADPVTPSRLLALLDKAKAYPLLKAYHSETGRPGGVSKF